MQTYTVEVRFSDCDGLGHVNNTVYFVYMEEARKPLFALFNPSLALEKWNLIIASAHAQFRKQAKYAERLTVETWVSKIGNASLTVGQRIANAQGETVAEGGAVLVCYDYAQQKSAPIPDEIRAQLAQWHRAEGN